LVGVLCWVLTGGCSDFLGVGCVPVGAVQVQGFGPARQPESTGYREITC
jgi:hypothetical protein